MRLIRVLLAFLLTLALFWVSPPLAPPESQGRFLESVTRQFLLDHVAVTRHQEISDPRLQVRVTTPVDTSDFRLMVHCCRDDDSSGSRSKLMPRVPGTFDLYAANLPAQEPGAQYRYHIELQDQSGKMLARLPEDTTEFITLQFLGQVPVWLLAVHIASLFFAAMFACLALIDTAWSRREDLKLRKLSQKVLTATALRLLGGFVTSAAVSQARRGLLWAGWPRGQDPAQTFWSAVILYWIVLT